MMPEPEDEAVRALTRHLNAIGNHAAKAETILSELFSANPKCDPAVVELLVMTRTIVETWENIATKLKGI